MPNGPCVLHKCKKTKPGNEKQNQCSKSSCRQRYVSSQARLAAGLHSGMEQRPLFPPSLPLLVMLWGSDVMITLLKRGTKREERKKNTPAYTKINKLIIKKQTNKQISLGLAALWHQGSVLPCAERGWKDGRVCGLCCSPCAAAQPSAPCGSVVRSRPWLFSCLEQWLKDVVQVLA